MWAKSCISLREVWRHVGFAGMKAGSTSCQNGSWDSQCLSPVPTQSWFTLVLLSIQHGSASAAVAEYPRWRRNCETILTKLPCPTNQTIRHEATLVQIKDPAPQLWGGGAVHMFSSYMQLAVTMLDTQNFYHHWVPIRQGLLQIDAVNQRRRTGHPFHRRSTGVVLGLTHSKN